MDRHQLKKMTETAREALGAEKLTAIAADARRKITRKPRAVPINRPRSIRRTFMLTMAMSSGASMPRRFPRPAPRQLRSPHRIGRWSTCCEPSQKDTCPRV
jgi:hypothetical protein